MTLNCTMNLFFFWQVFRIFMLCHIISCVFPIFVMLYLFSYIFTFIFFLKQGVAIYCNLNTLPFNHSCIQQKIELDFDKKVLFVIMITVKLWTTHLSFLCELWKTKTICSYHFQYWKHHYLCPKCYCPYWFSIRTFLPTPC